MQRGVTCFFAFILLISGCTAKVTHLTFPEPFPLEEVPLTDLTIPDLSPDLSPDSLGGDPGLHTSPIGLIGNRQVAGEGEKERERAGENEGNNVLAKVPEKIEEVASLPVPAPPSSRPGVVERILLPDLAITDLFLNSKKRLAITLANMGDAPVAIGTGELSVFVDGHLKERQPLSALTEKSFLAANERLTVTTSLTVVGRREIDAHMETGYEITESNKENNQMKKILEGLPVGPDIVVKDLILTEDLDFSVILSNAGQTDLRKGLTLGIQIVVNNRKISEFDHYVSESLRANSGNRYTVDPPYRISLSGISRVKVIISPKRASDDVHLGNNSVERTFIIFPLKMGPREKQNFSVFLVPPRTRDGDEAEKMKLEARLSGEGKVVLSVRGPSGGKSGSNFSGKTPLKAEVPLQFEDGQKGGIWKISITSLLKKKVEGHLLIQHP